METLRIAAGCALLWGLGTPSVHAEDIYKWTDEQGRVHYSNRGGSAESEQGDPVPGEEGWESVLERQRGTDEFTAKAESTINSLRLKMIKRKRDREQARAALEATQADIVRAQSLDYNAVPGLRAREVTQLGEVRKIEAELSVLEAQIAKLRAVKAAGKDLVDKSAPSPFGQ